MNEKITTTRHPMVPGPAPSGIADRAVALREQRGQPEQGVTDKAASPPIARLREPSPILPFQGVANLAKGIAGVMSEVGTIQKTGFNKFHGYAYATLQDLLFALCPLMGKHGVVVIQNEVERTAAETRIMVTYEFSVIHTSGEMWPERPRFTGMAIGRNKQGEWDDKAINKCHSAARKYFLLSLFQVPSGDFDDADEGPAQAPKQTETRERASPSQQSTANERAIPHQQPIPHERAGSSQQPIIDKRPHTVPGPATTSQQPMQDERLPHKLGFTPNMTPEQWTANYLSAVSKAATTEEIGMWDQLNNNTLQRISDNYKALYEKIDAAVKERLAQLPLQEQADLNTMPDPALDTGEALNWIAQKLLDMETLAEAEGFWNNLVAPREQEFDDMDWELLMQEWRRTEARLALPPPDEPQTA